MESSPAEAAIAGDFNPGLIISDELFYDSNAMSVPEIQAFLDQNIGSCLNSNCLNVVKTNTSSRARDAMCAAYQGAASESAASILFKVQQACGISAKVLLVTLQKEQSLVSHRQPTASRLDRAMGYACPDDTLRPGWCDPEYAGLYNQVYLAAWQLKRYGNPPGTSQYFNWYPVGSPSQIRYNPNPDCGASSVVVQNAATAALYYYTPYQPNASALANLYGSGDPCGAYGNRNFWRMYSDWFGDPVIPAGSPKGEVKELWTESNSIKMWGWAIDPSDIGVSIQLSIQLDNQWLVWVADAQNATAQQLFPGAGLKHGFGGSISASPGPHRVCVYAVNIGPGKHRELTCQNVVVPDGSPSGEVKEIWGTPNTVSAWGWAVDRDAVNAPATLHILVNDVWFIRKADQTYPTPGSVRGAGPNTGFGFALPASTGRNDVCVYAINTGPGKNTTLGCYVVDVPRDPSIPLPGTGAVSVKSGSSELIAGATVEIRSQSCEGAPVWRATTGSRGGTLGAFGISLTAGTYCLVTLSVPSGYSVPAPSTFEMKEGPGNWATVWLPSVFTGAVVAKNSSGAGIDGVTVRLNAGTCAESGRGVWEQTTSSNPWNNAGFGVTLAGGKYCVVTVAVPAGYLVPAPFDVDIQGPNPVWVTNWIPRAT